MLLLSKIPARQFCTVDYGLPTICKMNAICSTIEKKAIIIPFSVLASLWWLF